MFLVSSMERIESLYLYLYFYKGGESRCYSVVWAVKSDHFIQAQC